MIDAGLPMFEPIFGPLPHTPLVLAAAKRGPCPVCRGRLESDDRPGLSAFVCLACHGVARRYRARVDRDVKPSLVVEPSIVKPKPKPATKRKSPKPKPTLTRAEVVALKIDAGRGEQDPEAVRAFLESLEVVR